MFGIGTFFAGLLAVTIAAAPVAHQSKPIDTTRSSLTVYVYKSGLFSFAVDNHEIRAPIASGSVDEAQKSVELTVNAADLKVLDPKMPADKRAQVQAKMEGSDVLDSAKYPKITFHSNAVAFDSGGQANVTGDLTLHGQTHPVTVSVTRKSPGHYTGSASIQQTQFGITPTRIAGGLARVQNTVRIIFDVSTR
jgi:polyisoprenoid-binding protein YceI